MTTTTPEREATAPRRIDRRWVAASLLLHLCLVAALIGLWRPSEPPEVAIPVVVITDAPGQAGAAGGGGGTGEAKDQATAADSGAPDAAAQQEPTEQQATAEPTPPEPAPAQETAIPPPPVPTPAPALEATAPPPPRPPRKPMRIAHAPPEAKIAAAPPTPAPTPRPTPSAQPAESAAPSPGAGSGPGGTAGVGLGNEGAGHGLVGDGPRDGPGDDYLDALRRYLAGFKKYPPDAIEKKQEGEVVVGFVLKRDGTVLDSWIEHSSGIAALDEATLGMLRRASPVPPVPARFKGAELKLAMPIDYQIGFFERLFR
jgi:periplasmic protein TonB